MSHFKWFAPAVFFLAIAPGSLWAADASKPADQPVEFKAPPPGEFASLSVFPTKVNLRGLDDALQLVVTGVTKSGMKVDLTNDAQYEVGNGKLVRATPSGKVVPLANGSTQVEIQYGTHKLTVPVATAYCDVELPINFANQIVPILTKLSCNSGGCHGKASGQNGFKLSLLGFDAEADYQSLVEEARGRRVSPSSPDYSLLLTKAAGAVAHGGGKKMDVGSDEYRLIRRWIASGLPLGKPEDPKVTSISIFPENQIMPRNARQQFLVIANYSDGTKEDITRRAQYESNDQDIATVDGLALVRTNAMAGEAAIMVRYQEFVNTFRATVPLSEKPRDFNFPAANLVDQFTAAKWKQLGLVPAELCTDEQFIRRLAVDLTGTLPTPTEVKEFVESNNPNKRTALVDKLLNSPEYAYFFAAKWADILRVKRGGQADKMRGTFAFHGWIRDAVKSDMPYDQFAREILTATGDETETPPTVWYKSLQSPEQYVDDTAQVFLGLRLACAQCHHHPYEKWSQDDYWGLASFFGKIGRKRFPVPGQQNQNQESQRLVVYSTKSGGVTNKRSGKLAEYKPLDEAAVTLSEDDDPRTLLAEWMTKEKNPFFSKAIANRYWAHFFSRGIVDPLDDMRITNPPTNPELLQALADHLLKNKFSLKQLIRLIVNSRTYQLSPTPNDWNKHDKQNFARYYPRRMSAEVLFDAVCQVTDSPAGFSGLPQDKFAPRRAIMLPDEGYSSYFLDVFGRPQRISACECERVNEANLAQALHLLNSDEIQNKLSRANGRADMLAKDTKGDAEKLDELFLWAFARKPTPQQKEAALAHLAKHSQNKKLAYENILWALLNTKEFMFNQ
ncbi:MAG: DUF1553 domain-containing protein [Gemmataceae bacterium]|nr:DUF1553 domain-containing protein [Gemmataceae bacterium]